MARTVAEIRDLRTYCVNELYSQVRKEQKADQEYRQDTFRVDEIRDPHKVWRSGLGARIVDAPAEQIITSNPEVAFDILKGNKDIAIKLSAEVNRNWIQILRWQNPNPFKEYVKNLLGRGNAFIQICHNEAWINESGAQRGLPVYFLIPDPMVVYASPDQDEFGIPKWVIVYYKRQVRDVILKHPHWTNPYRKKGDLGEQVDWLEYWDKDIRYFEADEEATLKGGIQPNILGFVPFIQKYSGFGKRSPEGKLEDLIVSDLRLSRDLIKQECIKRSNIQSAEDIFAHRPKTLLTSGEIGEAQINELSWGSYDLNVLQGVPPDTRLIDETYPPVPAEMYASLANIRAEIAQRNPLILAGFPLGSSGRQDSMAEAAAMRRYDSIVENTENAWATAFDLALKIIKSGIIVRPEGLTKKDLEATFKCAVKLKASDPVEEDRKATLGSRLYAQKEIDLTTNLTQFKGYSQDRAQEIIVQMLADAVTINNPYVAQYLGMVAAKEMGMEDAIEYLQQQAQGMNQQQQGTMQPLTPTQQRRAQGEAETPLGDEMVDDNLRSRGTRRPPEGYFRQG